MRNLLAGGDFGSHILSRRVEIGVLAAFDHVEVSPAKALVTVIAGRANKPRRVDRANDDYGEDHCPGRAAGRDLRVPAAEKPSCPRQDALDQPKSQQGRQRHEVSRLGCVGIGSQDKRQHAEYDRDRRHAHASSPQARHAGGDHRQQRIAQQHYPGSMDTREQMARSLGQFDRQQRQLPHAKAQPALGVGQMAGDVK